VPFEVFIGYSSKDRRAADATVAGLEQEGVRCWIAPRDIPPGTPWASAIFQAIDQCRVLVLILSSRANGSAQVVREVARAAEEKRPIIPIRIEPAEPVGELGYYTSLGRYDRSATAGGAEGTRSKHSCAARHAHKGPIAKRAQDRERVRERAEVRAFASGYPWGIRRGFSKAGPNEAEEKIYTWAAPVVIAVLIGWFIFSWIITGFWDAVISTLLVFMIVSLVISGVSRGLSKLIKPK
jgi:hypothetical protein